MCDTMAIVEAGRVLFAKNSDRDANEAQILDWLPRASHPEGSDVQCTWISIPQVRETHAVLLSRPFWMWGGEIGTNEHGVTIGNEAVFTKEKYAKTGLLGMDMIRLALERCEGAERAVELIVELLETHGQGGGCGHEDRKFTYHNSFIVADPREAYVLETAGKKWATEKIEGARSISNGLTIPGFARRHSDLIYTRASGCVRRRGRSSELIGSATAPSDLMATLRDHGEGRDTPKYSWFGGAMSAPCMHAGGLVVGNQTTASWVAELTPSGVRHWVTGTSTPCLSLFKPVSVDSPIDLGPPPADTADGSLWWKHERLARKMMSAPNEIVRKFRAERDGIERRWLEKPPGSAAAFEEHGALVDGWHDCWLDRRLGESEGGADRARPLPFALRRYWALRNERAGIGA